MFDFSTLFETVEGEQKLSDLGMGIAALLGFGGGAAGAFDPTINPTGYQGSIPTYKAVRERVANTYDPTRRPGSGGRRYFTDTTFVDMGADNAEQALTEARSAAKTQAATLEAANLANPANQIRAIADTPVTETPVEEPLITPSFAAVPTAQSVLNQNTLPSEQTSPFTSPYQYIEDNPNSPLQVTPYSEGGLVELVEALRSAPELLAYLGAATGLGGLGSYAINRGMSAYRDAEAEKIKRMTDPKNFKKTGGMAELGTRKQRYLDGETDGMADEVPATIDNEDPAALSDGEYVIPADVVSHLGNGNSDAGAKVLDKMLSRVRKARTGETKQAPQINPKEFLPA